MKDKRNRNQTEECFKFESKYDSMKTIINSLENISAKCELFFRQFNICVDNQNQLDDYKKLLTGFKLELGSEYVRQSSYENRLSIDRRSDDQSDNDSDFEPNVSENHFNDFDGQSSDNEVETKYQNGDQSLLDQLDSKIMDFYKKDKKSGKRVRHYGCAETNCDYKSDRRSKVVTHLLKHSENDNSENRCLWPKCEKSFGFRNSLISHIESYHLRKERYKCCVEECGQSFLNKLGFIAHMNGSHLDITDHKCRWTQCHLKFNALACLWPKCGKQFPNKELLETHMECIHLKRNPNFQSNEDMIEDSNWIKCDQKDCDFQTLYKNELIEHMTHHKSRNTGIKRRRKTPQTDQPSEPALNKYTGKPLAKKRRPKNFRCSWPACDAMFESQHTVALHMRKHTGEKPYSCDWPECGKTFRFKGALKLHNESIHLKLKQFKCDQCDEAFLLQTALTVHKSKHTGVKRLQCDWPGCEWRTNFSQQLEIHRMRRHEGKKVYLKRYKCKNKSDPHSMYDPEGNLKPYPCEWPGCERRFRYEFNLEPHMKWHQKSENEPKVRKKYQNRPRVSKPRQRKEKRDKPVVDKQWKCEWPHCQSSYTTKNMLSQHMNTHTGLRPYQCDNCEQAFAYKTSLSSHIATNHPTEDQMVDRPHKCDYFGCNRSFDKPRALMAHQRIVHHYKSNNDNLSAHPIEDYSPSPSYSSPPPPPQQELPLPESYIFQKNVIRLDRIRAFNTLQIQTPNQSLMSYPSASNRRERLCSTPTSQTTHTTAKKLLSNAKRPRAQPVENDSETIARELPHSCPHSGCWRRFKTIKALDWHFKKFHN